MAGEVLMSLKEVDRYAVIEQVLRRTMRQADAVLWPDVSVRQIKRLARAVRNQGTGGVISRRRGVLSNRAIKAGLREHYLSLVRGRYGDFGPTLAAEYLAERHGFILLDQPLGSPCLQVQAPICRLALLCTLLNLEHSNATSLVEKHRCLKPVRPLAPRRRLGRCHLEAAAAAGPDRSQHEQNLIGPA